MGRLNRTYSTALVLQALARGFHHGFDIMDATGLPSGTVYPILRRLDREGLLASTALFTGHAFAALREGLRAILDTQADFEVVGEAGDGST